MESSIELHLNSVMTQARTYRLHLLPASFWAIVIVVLSVLPGKDMPKINFWEFLKWDAIGHLSFYGVLSYLCMYGVKKQYGDEESRFNSGKMVFLLCFAFGLSLEAIQGLFLQDRYFSILDLLANGVGILLGVCIFTLLFDKRKTPHS